MDSHIIKNFETLASTDVRKVALQIAEAGLNAIDTTKVIEENLTLEENILKIKDKKFDLNKFKKIYVLGFGKASCNGVIAIDNLLQDHIAAGIAIDITTAHCDNPNILFFQGTHPKPSLQNVTATQEILNLAQKITPEDLVICIVSGGGSALLCASEQECQWHVTVYDEFLKTGGNINELNTLRKHSSILKGGGLAKLFSQATLIGLIFSDIPGGQIEDVASGPTFKDQTTLKDVRIIIDKYKIAFPSSVQFFETPKEDGIFKNVTNILLVSNHLALDAMFKKSQELGLNPQIFSETISEKVDMVAKKINEGLGSKEIRLGAGEPSINPYKGTLGKGGRNQQLVLESLPYLKENQVFISLASDGIDNTDMAGAIADAQTLPRSQMDYENYRQGLNAYPFFENLEDLINTGPTGANISDLMIALKL